MDIVVVVVLFMSNSIVFLALLSHIDGGKGRDWKKIRMQANVGAEIGGYNINARCSSAELKSKIGCS
jgi:hypothetical protein